jgi:RNA polymerase sigma-70 factor (ECF subfamily)
MSDDETPLHDLVQRPWRTFLEQYEPLRPDLYRYCRYLTRSPWDAEDLVQDTLARAFVTLGGLMHTPSNPRAWLFRVASNQWLNQVKRSRLALPADFEDVVQQDLRDAREAAGSLVALLAPQERAALVLKEVFDFSLEEIAESLSTTTGAVKAALHRGRGKLAEADEQSVAVAPVPVLDAFCEAFNARDIERVTSLLLDNVELDFPGLHHDYGAEAARRALGATMHRSDAFIAPAFRQQIVEGTARFAMRAHRGEQLLIAWWQHADGEAVRAFSRLEVEGERIARMTTYFHTPEAISELCRELALPCRTNGYRPWW